MLEGALQLATFALALSTAFLVAAGQRPWGGRMTRIAAVLVVLVLAATGYQLSALPEGMVTGAVIAIVAIALPRHWYLAGAVFFSSLLVAFGLYVAYLARATALLGSEPIGLALGLVLFCFELAALTLLGTSAFEMVDALSARPLRQLPAEPPPRWPVVCVQVPTYNEPPELVIETLHSLVALDYPALRLQIIDNNTADPDLWRPVKAECARLESMGHRIDFIHLPEWPGYKAGALNWGLAHLAPDVEIIGVVDADYVVDRAWLRATVPHFGDPAVAFVQTPQDYRAWEESTFYRACYVGFALFFTIGMVSRSRRNAIIFAGTMGLVRRSALDEIGGWDERIITEDAEASLRMLAKGHRSVYLPFAYGRGIMPLTYEGLRRQRYRWAFGGIQILRRHWRALMPWNRQSSLNFAQRYDHLMGALWWFNDALTLGFSAFVFAAAVGAIVGRPFVVQRLTALGVVLPSVFIALNLTRYLWALRTATGASLTAALAALRVNLSLSWVIALACFRGLTQTRGVFLRTPKFRGAPAIRELRLVWVESTIGVVALGLLLGVLLRDGYTGVGLALSALIGWSLIIYGSAAGYALGDPTRAPGASVLRRKALLELAPRIGRAARARPARVGAGALVLSVVALALAVAVESGRSALAELPFPEVPQGPAQPPAIAARQSSSAQPTPSQSGTPSKAPPTAGAFAPPGSASTSPSAGLTPGVPTPTPTASARPTPPVPIPTPTVAASASARPTPPVPVPTPSRRP